MSKLSAAAFAAFLMERSDRKDGYIMGSIGQDPKKWGTSSWYFTQYKGAQRTKALYWRKNAERVFDCQGLAEGYINDQLGTSINVYARTNYANWCDPKGKGRIPAQYRKPGAAVFYDNGSRVTHVGYLVKPVVDGKSEGDWYVVEARGVMYGVVTTKLYSRSWNRWGLMTKYFDYDDVEVKPVEFGDRILRLGMTGEDVKEMQSILIELGYSCGEWGADGDFGSATLSALTLFQEHNALAADGEMNQDDFDALREALEDESPDEGDDDADPVIDPDPVKPTEDYSGKLIVDISRWNGRIQDVDKLKSAVAFVIHRASCGQTKDSVVDYNCKAMRKAGIPYGVYHYLQCLTIDDAVREARVFYSSAAAHFPKFWTLDCEYAKITAKGHKSINNMVAAFVNELINLGVPSDRIGLYIGHHLYNSWRLDYASFAFVWIPRYGKNTGEILNRYFPAYKCDLHQYTSVGKCPGIADKTVDLNRITGSGKDIAWFRGDE